VKHNFSVASPIVYYWEMSEYTSAQHITGHLNSFRRWVFPGNHLHWYSAGPSTPVRTAHMRVLITLWYTIQHWTVLIIFTLILQTIITAQMMSTGGEGPEGGSLPLAHCTQYLYYSVSTPLVGRQKCPVKHHLQQFTLLLSFRIYAPAW